MRALPLKVGLNKYTFPLKHAYIFNLTRTIKGAIGIAFLNESQINNGD